MKTLLQVEKDLVELAGATVLLRELPEDERASVAEALGYEIALAARSVREIREKMSKLLKEEEPSEIIISSPLRSFVGWRGMLDFQRGQE